MKEVNYIITDEMGIHARPAGLLAKAISKFDSNVIIKKGGQEGNAKSIIGIMTLGVKKGDMITFWIEGKDETEASEAIQGFLNENL